MHSFLKRLVGTTPRRLALAVLAAASIGLSLPSVRAQVLYLPDGTGLIGHLIGASPAPVGTGCTIAAGSTDAFGRCVTSATSGSIAFFRAYAAAPFCVVQDGTATPVTVYTTTTAQITLTTVTSAHTLYWACFGAVGG